MDHAEHLSQVVLLLSAAVFVVAIFKRLNLSPVLGYLVAGAAIGEHGIGYINSQELTLIAEVGIVFLLFAIGLELTLERLIAMRWHVFGFGTAQVAISMLAICAICMAAGLSVEASVLIGGALALSSTAIVLRVINDNRSQNTQVGRLALANLLLQDFAVVPLLVLVPLLAAPQGGIFSTIGVALVKACITLVIIFFLGRMLLRPLFKLIASSKSNELFIAATLLVVLGSSLATELMGLSLAMGAFVAGLLVAETQYQHQVEDNIMPFKDLFMGLFFMSVGMTIDLDSIYDKMFLIFALSAALLLIKSVIIISLCKFFGFPWGSAIHAGLLLSQGGEFAFILFTLASQQGLGLLLPDTAEILMLVVTFTMALTPALSSLGSWINQRMNSQHDDEDDIPHYSDVADLNRHVVIAGFGRTGTMIARLLTAKKVNYIVLEADIKRAKKGRSMGFPVYHGDPSKIDVLRNLNMDRAKAAIITIPDTVYMKKAIRTIHKYYPDIPIVARAEDLRNHASLKKLGATVIVPEKYETGLQMGGSLLAAIGLSDIEISKLKNQFRDGRYEKPEDIQATTSDHA